MDMTPESQDHPLSFEKNGDAPGLAKKSLRTLPNRACSECRRKKSRCDMIRPECSLCYRIGAECIYPTRRAAGRMRNAISNSTIAPNISQRQEAPLRPPTDGMLVDDHPPFKMPSLSREWDDAMPSPSLPSFQTSADHFLFPTVDIDFSDMDFDNMSAISGFGEAGPTQISDGLEGGIAHAAETDDGPDLSNTSHTAVASRPQSEFTLAKDHSPSSYSIDISPAAAMDLVDKFFGHIHFYLPLLHQDKFKREHDYILSSTVERLYDLPLETAFLLCGIFALSARFSKSNELLDEQPIHRGDRFARQAAQLFELSSNQLENSTPSMSYLQATILLTFFTVQSRPSRQAWLRNSTCVRLAYELELHICDADIISGGIDINSLSPEEYLLREERRRAWWVIWDVDTFLSFMALRPSAAGHHKIQVLLPIPDQMWLTGKIVPSAYLEPERAIPWRRLCDSPDQSAWAWFLALTILARQVTDILLSPSPSEEVLEEVQAKFACYALALPESFRIDLDPGQLNTDQAQGMNWIISSLLISQSLRALIAVRRDSVSLSKWHRDSISSDDDSSPPKNAIRSQNINMFGSLRHEVARWIHHWPVESFTQCSPLICACLIGPALSYASDGEKLPGILDCLDRQTIILAMKRLARHWMISKVLLDKLDQMREGQVNLATEQTTLEQAVRHHWRSMMIW